MEEGYADVLEVTETVKEREIRSQLAEMAKKNDFVSTLGILIIWLMQTGPDIQANYGAVFS